ncbi:uncharacterized protein Dvar_27720 [Desulfosarcina variabilis str. Montpellier]
MPNIPGAPKTELMAEGHGDGNRHDRSTGYSEFQIPHPNQEDRPEAFADNWHSATVPRKRATLGPHLFCHLKIYFVKKGK